MDYIEMTDEEYKEFCKQQEEQKTRNGPLRGPGETFYSELSAGAQSFDAKYSDQFYRMVVKR
jgi:hypothetical protein